MGGFAFQYKSGHKYLGGFIGEPENQEAWIKPQIDGWVRGVEKLAKVAKRYPQTAYVGLTKSLQAEWQYIQRVTPDIGPHFERIEAAIRDTFLPALLGDGKVPDETLRALMALGSKEAGIGITDPVASAPHCHEASEAATGVLTGSLLMGEALNGASHKVRVKRERVMARKRRQGREKAEKQSNGRHMCHGQGTKAGYRGITVALIVRLRRLVSFRVSPTRVSKLTLHVCSTRHSS